MSRTPDLLSRWVWTLAAGGGATFSWANYQEALRDREAVHRLPGYRPDGARAIIANGNARRELMRCWIQWTFGIAGVLSLLAPGHRGARIGIRLALFAAQGLILYKDYADRRDRRRVIDLPPGVGRRRTD